MENDAQTDEEELDKLNEFISNGLNKGLKEKITYKPNLSSVKIQQLKANDFKKQICMRCAKADAVNNDIFCEKCIKERERIDEILSKE